MLDASGLIHLQGQYFLVAEDEVDRLRVFEHVPASRSFRVTSRCVDFGAQESDFESIAYDPESDYYFVIGSHGADYSKKLLRFKLRDFAACEIAEISFEPEFIIGQSQINIEALSIYQGSLLIGYRSPSVNDKAVATLFNPDNNVQLLTTFDLHNRVFRDMVCIDAHNYLLLAGPERWPRSP